MRKFRKYISATLIICMLSNGCGALKNSTQVPELLEPIVNSESYVVVERGSVGTPTVQIGEIQAIEYPQFFETGIQIKEIKVKRGDKVKKGDIIASADIDTAKEMIANYESELEAENEQYELTVSENDIAIANLEAKLSGNITDLEKSQINVSIAEIQENKSYDEILHKRIVENINSSIDEQKKLIDNSVLYADHDGTIDYVVSASALYGVVTTTDIIAIIRDDNEKYVEIENYTISKYELEDYESRTVMAFGEERELSIKEYSEAELFNAKVYKKELIARFTFDGISEMKEGDYLVVYFTKKRVDNVLYVNNSCIHADGTRYVYVFDEKGNKIRKNVEVGFSDSFYSEIVSGLSEGEKVCCEFSNAIPSKMEEYTIEAGELKIKNSSNLFTMEDAESHSISAGYEGEIVEVSDKLIANESIEKGDFLFSIKTGEGQAAILKAKYDIEDAEGEKEEALKAIDAEIKALKEAANSPQQSMDGNDQIASGADAAPVSNTDYSKQIDNLETRRKLTVASYDKQIKKLQKTYDELSKNNDGTGVISVYSEYSGKIDSTKAKMGLKVGKSDQMLVVSSKSVGRLLVYVLRFDRKTFYPDNMADYGEMVKFSIGGSVYNCQCIGKGEDNKTYVCEKNGKVYFPTYSAYSYTNNTFFVEQDPENTITDDTYSTEIEFIYYNFENVVMLNKEYIYTETVKGEDYYYVWKKDGDSVSKQYITIKPETFTNGTQNLVLSGLKIGDVIITK